MPDRRTVIVTDGEQRVTLAIVRSLGRAGHRVVVCASRARSLAGASRYCAARETVADALVEPARFVDDLVRACERHGATVLIPVAEPALLAALAARERFDGVCIPFPDVDAFRRVCDKGAVLAAAASLGIAVPAQHRLETIADAASLDLDALAYPLVIKPLRSVSESNGARIKLGVRHASDAAHLRRELAEFDERAYPLLLQQRIVGPGIGVFLLVWDGRTMATFAHRRIREKPPSGGVSVYRESVEADPLLLERSRALLDLFDWRGVAMVEFKVDEATGTPYLMEINGRFWGSLQLAVDAGVDFPVLLIAAATGEPKLPVRFYRTGIRSRWLLGDVDHLLARLRRSDEELSLPPGSPSVWAAVRDFLTVRPRRDRAEVLRFGDPLPFLRATIEWVTNS